MRKRKFKSIFTVIFVIILMMISNYCNATYNDYIDIDSIFVLKTNGICLSEIKFENLTDTSNVFGVTGKIENEEDIDKNIVITLNFYDKYYNIVAVLESTQYIRANETLAYNNFENISEINDGYSVDDIKYYDFIIEDINKIKSTTSTISNRFDYEIDDYKIDMVVNENNTFDITETITANFNVAKHGIFRKIPLKNSITRIDRTKSNNIAKITNISVNEKYSTSIKNGYKVIKIGQFNKTVTGRHTYIIKYTYNIGKDPIKDADELYFNLIGNEWDTIINNVSFNILMPKPFDKSQLDFSSGKVGSIDSTNVNFEVDGNNIKGIMTKILNVGDCLTIRLSLPEDYFVGESINIDVSCFCLVILSISFVCIACYFWIKYGKDNKVVETVEFYPPDGYNSAEVNFLYKGSLEDTGVISLLIYLANQGYIKIEETETEAKTKDFKIIKIKEYDGNNKYEKMFFDGLFINNEKDFVTTSELYNKFYITLKNIKNEMDKDKNKEKIFELLSINKIKYLFLMITTIFILITIKPIFEYKQLDEIPLIMLSSLSIRNWFFIYFRKSYKSNRKA